MIVSSSSHGIKVITWEMNGPFALCLYRDRRCGRHTRDITRAVTREMHQAPITEALSYKVVTVSQGGSRHC